MGYSIFALSLCLASVAAVADDAKDKVILASESYSLTKEEIAKYSQEAMAGSPEAAEKLVNSYWMRGVPDREKTKYWALIGAENGNVESQFRAYQTLHISTKKLDQERALFWLKRAAAQDALSKSILESCPTLSSQWYGGPCFGPGSD